MQPVTTNAQVLFCLESSPVQPVPVNAARVSFPYKTGRKFSIAIGIPFNIHFPGSQAGLLSAMPKSLQLSVLSGCLNSGVPKGRDKHHGHSDEAQACVSLASPGAHSSSFGAQQRQSWGSSTFSFIPQPARHGQTSHRQPPPAPPTGGFQATFVD